MNKQIRKLSVLFLIALAVVISGLTDKNTVNAADITTYNINEREVYIYNNGNYIIKGDGTATQNRIVITSGLTNVNITLSDVNIDRSGTNRSALAIDTGSKLYLTLKNSNTLKGGQRGAGIYVANNSTLVITEESGDASLEAIGSLEAAGIGGKEQGYTGGTIIIKGGKITAKGGSPGAGIGGAKRTNAGTISIEGGTINATGGDCSAGIGGGGVQDENENANGGNGGNITISGGTVTANGGFFSAGIGGGFRASGGIITITGGKVTAKGGYQAAGIGGGGVANSSYYPHINPDCGTIEISGGVIVAEGSSYGAGIGTGIGGSSTGSISISGDSDVKAIGGTGGAGIGGAYGVNGPQITISDNCKVTAEGSLAAGIGGGYNGSNTSIIINGGVVNATCNDTGVGIGGGKNGSGGSIIINGGTVTAKGRGQYGIGDGNNGSGGSVMISAGSVNASINVTPTSDGTNPVYQAVLPLNIPSKISSKKIKYHIDDGPDISGVMTDGDGKLYFWLNNGAHTIDVFDIDYVTYQYSSKVDINSSNIEATPFNLKVKNATEEVFCNSWTLACNAVKANGTIALLSNVHVTEDSEFPTVACVIDGGANNYSLTLDSNMQYPSTAAVLQNLSLTINGTLTVGDSYLALEGGKLSGQGTIVFLTKNTGSTGYPGLLVLNKSAQIQNNAELKLQIEFAPQAEDIIITNASGNTALSNINKITLGSGFDVFTLDGRTGTYIDASESKNCYQYVLKKAVRTISMTDYTTSYTGSGIGYGLAPVITPDLESGEEIQYAYYTTEEDRENYENAITPIYPGTYYVRASIVESDRYLSAYQDAHLIITKAVASLPPLPTASSIRTTEIVLTEITNARYKIEGGDWQESNVFSDLLPGQAYTFYVMTVETETEFASEPSSNVIYTRPLAPEASVVIFDFHNETISFDDAYEMNTTQLFDGTTITNHMSITDYIGQTVYIRKKAVDGATLESDAIAITIPDRPVAPDISRMVFTYDETVGLATATVHVDEAMGELQYYINDGSWQSSNIFLGLDVNTDYAFTVSYQPTESAFRSKTTTLTREYSLAKINSVSATNGEIQVVLDRVPTQTVVDADFEAFISVDGEASRSISLTDFSWSEASKTIAFCFNPVIKKSFDQNVVISVSYRGNAVVNADSFIVDQIRPSGVTLDRKTLLMSVSGSAIKLNATVVPADAGNKEVSWTTSNDEVVSVDNGMVIPVATGSAIIIVRTVDGGYEDSCEVTVVEDSQIANISSITVSNGTIDIILDKVPVLTPDMESIQAFISVDYATEEYLTLNNFQWDEATRAITIHFDPLIPKEEDQEVRITLSYNDISTVSSAYIIPGTYIKVTGVSLNQESISLPVNGSGVTLVASVYPDNATNPSMIWQSSNPRIASVEDGIITPHSAGTVTITVTTVDGQYSADCIVRIYRNDNPSGSNTDTDNEKQQDASSPVSSEGETGTDANNIINVVISNDKKEGTEEAPKLVLPAEAILKAIETGKKISITVEDKEEPYPYSWTFDTKQMKNVDELAEINLEIKRSNGNDDPELDEVLGSDKDNYVVFRFAHEGRLPASASVRIYVGDQEGFTVGKKIYLYHINQETGKLETLPFSSDYVIDEKGYITIDIVHCSDYVVFLEEPKDIVSLRNQIKVSPTKATLFVKNKKKNSADIVIKLPYTLEVVKSLKDATSQTAVGGLTVKYSSSNSKVVKVNKYGHITAVGEGKAVITTTIKLYSGKTKIVKTTIIVK
jgi:uncharacterized protein YjdB